MEDTKQHDLASLLPEGVTEETITSIAEAMRSMVEQRVQEEVEALTDKVYGYLSMKRDSIKEAALEELHEESQVHRDAAKFQELLGYMAIEHRPEFIDAQAQTKLDEAAELVDDNTVLANELTLALKEQERLAKKVQLLEGQVAKRESEVEALTESVKYLEADKEAALFESTEQAVVITNNVDEEVEEEIESLGNTFLTEEMLNLMK
jgi:hypothetical protein